MKIYNTSDFQIEECTAVTLGNFDGIHLGHQKLINTVNEYAKRDKLKSVVFSFSPHPVVFFNKENNFKTMLSYTEKAFVLEKMGLDILVQYPFDSEFASLEPEKFIEFLIDKTNCKVLVVGENYCFGKNRKGTYQTLKKIGESKGLVVITIPSVMVNDKRVSSTRIRELITEGKMETVRELLDKPYFIIGSVEKGDRRGTEMGFPTINMTVTDKLLPPDGVYATKVAYDGKVYSGVTNVGIKPTFNGQNRNIETHIFDFNDDLYGKFVQVCFYKYIRPEKKFDNIDKLKEQIELDRAEAMKWAGRLDRTEYKFR